MDTVAESFDKLNILNMTSAVTLSKWVRENIKQSPSEQLSVVTSLKVARLLLRAHELGVTRGRSLSYCNMLGAPKA